MNFPKHINCIYINNCAYIHCRCINPTLKHKREWEHGCLGSWNEQTSRQSKENENENCRFLIGFACAHIINVHMYRNGSLPQPV